MNITFERLKKYNIIAAQKKRMEEEYMPSYIKGVDISKPAIQNNKISDSTADLAIATVALDTDSEVKAEYTRLSNELMLLNNYIYGISDELVKAIAIRYFIYNESYRTIGKDLNYNKTSVSKKLREYIEKNCHM